MAGEIRSLIAETDRWKVLHALAGRKIEVWACAIRLKALHEALMIVEHPHGR